MLKLGLRVGFAAMLGVFCAAAGQVGSGGVTSCPTGTTPNNFASAVFGSTWSTCGNTISGGSIDTTLDVNNATLNALNSFLGQSVAVQDLIVPEEGAAMQTTFSTTGGTLGFGYTFLANTTSFAFMILDGTQYDLGFFQGGNVTANIVAVPTQFSQAIGAGNHTIAFGVANGIFCSPNPANCQDPDLTISALDVNSVPEPATLGVLGLALLGVAVVHRARRRSRQA